MLFLTAGAIAHNGIFFLLLHFLRGVCLSIAKAWFSLLSFGLGLGGGHGSSLVQSSFAWDRFWSLDLTWDQWGNSLFASSWFSVFLLTALACQCQRIVWIVCISSLHEGAFNSQDFLCALPKFPPVRYSFPPGTFAWGKNILCPGCLWWVKTKWRSSVAMRGRCWKR